MNVEARTAIILLLKGLFYKQDNEKAWLEMVEKSYGAIKDYFETIALELRIDEEEGYAYLKNRDAQEDEEALPKLIRSRELSYKVSLLIVLLRQKIADFEMQSDDFKAVITLQEIEDQLLLYLPLKSNEVKTSKEIASTVKKVEELGFLRKLKHQEGVYEIKRAIKAFVDAQWLNEFDQRLEAYRQDQTGASQ